MKKENNILNHDFGYGIDIAPNKIKKLYLGNINDLKEYIKDIIFTNIIETKKVKISDITNIIQIEKIKN